MDTYKRIKKDNKKAKKYHRSYDWLLTSLEKFGVDGMPLNFDEENKSHHKVFHEKKKKYYNHVISKVDIAYMVAKDFISYKIEDGVFKVYLTTTGNIFVTEEKGFRIHAKKRLERARYQRNQNYASVGAIIAIFVTSFLTAIGILGDQENLVGRWFRDLFCW